IEAGMMGLKIVGCDISKRMVCGAKKNLQWVGLKPLGILRADASRPPIKKADVVVTDPPYGVSASTAGRSYSELYGSLLNYSSLILPSGGRLVLVHPRRFDLKVPEKNDFKEVHSFSIRVHRSLTRIVKVFERY
ncbi:MAG: methyltransferase, partial [Nitrososphaeria archaeon]|nr:methyltransferase [Nitrososphaeria archaeon]